MEGTIEGLSPKRTKTCMNVSNFVKDTSFLENPRRVPIVCYIFLRILPLSFLLAKNKKKNNESTLCWACIQDIDRRDGGVCGADLLHEISGKLILKPSS